MQVDNAHGSPPPGLKPGASPKELLAAHFEHTHAHSSAVASANPKDQISVTIPAGAPPSFSAAPNIYGVVKNAVLAAFIHAQLNEIPLLSSNGLAWKTVHDAIRTADKNGIDLNALDYKGWSVVRNAILVDLLHFVPGYPILTEALFERCGFDFNLETLLPDTAAQAPLVVVDKLARQQSTAHYQRVCRIVALLMRHKDANVNLCSATTQPALVSLLSVPCEELQPFCLVRATIRMICGHPSFRADPTHLSDAHAAQVFDLIHPHHRIRRYLPSEKRSFAAEVLVELLRHGLPANRLLPVSLSKPNRLLPLLYLAIARDYPPDVVAILIQNGAKVNYVDSLGNSLLHLAVAKENVNALRVLITEGMPRGLDLFAQDKHGRTAMALAVVQSGFANLVADPLVDVLVTAQQASVPIQALIQKQMSLYIGDKASALVMDMLAGPQNPSHTKSVAVSTLKQSLKRRPDSDAVASAAVCEVDEFDDADYPPNDDIVRDQDTPSSPDEPPLTNFTHRPSTHLPEHPERLGVPEILTVTAQPLHPITDDCSQAPHNPSVHAFHHEAIQVFETPGRDRSQSKRRASGKVSPTESVESLQ